MLVTENSKEYAGFLTLRAQDGENTPKGFVPSYDICYTDAYEMIDSYEDEWENRRSSNKTQP